MALFINKKINDAYSGNTITSLSGDVLEMIEEDLVNFTKVVKGQLPIETVITDPIMLVKFHHKMEFLAMELEFTKRLMESNERNLELLEKDKSKSFYPSWSHVLSIRI